MKASELMIEDWVCVTKNFTQKYHKIRALSNDEEDVLKGTYINDYGVECNSIFSCNDIQPIPLTPEILEKNGFYYDEDRKAYLMGVIFQVKPERYGLFSLKICGCPYPLSAVHELQHALRLCGIDKEIVL